MGKTYKVEYGFKNFGYQIIEEGNTAQKPVIVPGAVSFKIENAVEDVSFTADDNTSYYKHSALNEVTGEIEIAAFPDDFLVKVLGYIKLTNGAIAPPDNAKTKNVHLFTEATGGGDEGAVGIRRAFLNCTFSIPDDDEQETGKNIKPKSIKFTALGLVLPNGKRIRKFKLKEGDVGYEKLYTEGITADLSEVVSA